MDHALYRVTSFAIVGPFVLDVRFDDGTRQRIDLQPVLHGELYGALRDAGLFERVAIDPEAHTLVWPNGADFDPATLHDWPDAGRRMIDLARRWADADARGCTASDAMPARHRIIGIDRATTEANTGLALAVIDDGGLRIHDTTVGDRRRPARAIVEEWLTDSDDAALMAIDAPLGWPRPLSASLESHSAGSAIDTPADDMFRRATDVFIKEKIKRPLDVGADKIARTAHAALRLLGELRHDLGVPIPLAWNPADVTDHAVIEVYPASTLIAHEIPPGGRTRSGFRLPSYKGRDKIQQRREIVDALRKRMTIPEQRIEDLCGNDDLLDAVVCVLAAQDFLTGRAAVPADRHLAEREGWIWTALPEGTIYTARHE